MRQNWKIARFDLLRRVGKALVLVLPMFLFLSEHAFAQDELNVLRGESSNNRWLHYSDVENALYHHLADEAYQHLNSRKEHLSELESLSDWQKRQGEIREALQSIVGPFPEKTSLNARIQRTIQKDTYKVEHIVFESQPDFFVTSSLFIPNGLTEKAPVVIYVSGHTAEGYRSEIYQHKILNLVDKNFIVFAFDPVGQGERLEYNFGNERVPSSFGSPAGGHSYSGLQGYITGNTQAQIMIWDGIRAVDYLLTRDEIDPERIGITGRSGGGTQSSYIAAFDDRIYAAAPESYITNFTRLLQSIGPQDAEQVFAGGIANGIDHADLLAVRAPKPTLMIATTEDYFSIQGARETANEVLKIYSAYNEENHFEMVEDFGEHGSTEKNREAMYSFFQDVLDNPGNSEDVDVEILSDEDNQVTETGQVFTSLSGKTISDLNREKAELQFSQLKNDRENLDQHLSEIVESAKNLSGYRETESIKEPVFTGRIQREGYVIEKYFLEGEGKYPIPYLLIVPENSNDKAVLYLHPNGKMAEASESGQIEWFVQKGFTVLAPDLIGTGETSPGGSGNLLKEWHASVLIDRSITGIRAGDINRLTQLLKQKNSFSDIYSVAVQEMSQGLLHSAAISNSFSRVALIDPLISYRSLVSTKYYDPGFTAGAVLGSMQSYDLPGLAASLAPGKLLMINPVNGANGPADEEDIDKDTRVIHATYDQANLPENFRITGPQTEDEIFESLEEWINN
ncbi:alpha/beta hydrolase family protein [Rhodohalobacter sulfatireducens]|uniref:Acetylxylan esterase n=1 Tax=Rhodohalobacter sulfatireducens TaxID=2911366 RepID=A0ABS9K9L4_9BACT|nr:alpha/beta hydrolase family protein [Rhodohalobacter sulfatireducens]MCG2587541.1 acetylxylan esterase [Rhodohalobacter sulfatireducens]